MTAVVLNLRAYSSSLCHPLDAYPSRGGLFLYADRLDLRRGILSACRACFYVLDALAYDHAHGSRVFPWTEILTASSPSYSF